MLFNKNETGIDELKELTGFLYAYNNFSNISTDIQLAGEDIQKVIGKDVYAVALAHYKSEHYQQASPDVDPPVPSYEVLTELVKCIQLPVAYYAIHSFSQNTDVSHEDSGRKVKIDADREKLPWEWMLEKDERAILRKAHRTTDRLLQFLENHREQIEVWKNSDQRKKIMEQFINSAEEFSMIYPIEESERFFITISPFIREVERKNILPVLGKTRYDELKAAMADTETEFEDEDNLIPHIQTPIALLAMSIAVDRLALEVLPEGVFQNIVSDTANAKQPAKMEAKRQLSKQLADLGRIELNYLQEYLRKLDGAGEYTGNDLLQGIDDENKFARV